VLTITAVVELVYLDDSGSRGAVTMHVDATSLATDIAAEAEALAAIIAPVTGCVLVTERIKYRIVQVPPLPDATGVSVKRVGAFFFSTNPPLPDAIITLPGILDSILETTGACAGYCIDVSNSDVISFVDAVIALNATNPFGDDITDLNAAYLQSRV
jgi:hypothetical protein